MENFDQQLRALDFAVFNFKYEGVKQMAQDKKHVHYDKILEWAADPGAVWQKSLDGKLWEYVEEVTQPLWASCVIYRKKPRWFEMNQEWIAKGKPPVEVFLKCYGNWEECSGEPGWLDDYEYRFPEWLDDYEYRFPAWHENVNYRLKPIPHPDADVLRALADDVSLKIEVSRADHEFWVTSSINEHRLRINQ